MPIENCAGSCDSNTGVVVADERSVTDSSFFPFLLTLSQLVHEGPPLPQPKALFVLADAVEDSIGADVKIENGEEIGIGLDVPHQI